MHFGNMGNAGSFIYSVNGKNMGADMDPNEIYKLFFNRGSEFGAFQNMTGNARNKSSGKTNFDPRQNFFKGFSNFGDF